MLGGRGHLRWYDCLLIALAAAIIFPDEIVERLSRIYGRVLGTPTLVAVVLVGVVAMIVTTAALLPLYPRLSWWHPVLYVGTLAFCRIGMWCVSSFFGFDD